MQGKQQETNLDLSAVYVLRTVKWFVAFVGHLMGRRSATSGEKMGPECDICWLQVTFYKLRSIHIKKIILTP